MKVMAATRLIAAMSVAAVAVAWSVPASAQEGPWDANFSCAVSSPERGDAPRVTLSVASKGDTGARLASSVRFRLFNIARLSDAKSADFPDTVAEIPGFAAWTGLKANGRQEKSGYALYIPLPDLAKVTGPMEGGRVLKVTVQAKDGPATFEVDLRGSARAIASLRLCAT